MAHNYYNPQVFTPKTMLQDVQRADLNDYSTCRQISWYGVYASRKDALKEDIQNTVYFRENGVIYQAERIPEWAWRCCTGVRTVEKTEYTLYIANSPLTLKTYFPFHDVTFDSMITYNPILGVYSVTIKN